MSGLKNVSKRYNDALSRIDWQALERLLAAYYRDIGWWVEHVGTGGSGTQFDGGIDLKLRRGSEYVLVQCKHWNAKQVPHNAVHELIGLMVNESATGAILISSGEFTRAAVDAAQRQGHVKLIDGETLRGMLGTLPDVPDATDPFVEAVMDAVTHGPAARSTPVRRARARGVSPAGTRAMPIWWGLALVAVVGFLLIIRAILIRTADTAEAPPAETADEMALQPTITIYEPVPITVRRAPPMPPPRPPPPTDAEIRESQRKADEAMRLIQDRTPEMH